MRGARAGAEPANKHVLIVPTAHVAVLRLVARCRSAWAKLDSPSIIAKCKAAYLSARTTNTAGCCTHVQRDVDCAYIRNMGLPVALELAVSARLTVDGLARTFLRWRTRIAAIGSVRRRGSG